MTNAGVAVKGVVLEPFALRALDRLAETIVVVALLGELLLVLANVMARVFFRQSFLWSDEVARLVLSILAFIGGAVAYRRRDHAQVRLILNLVPSRVERVCRDCQSMAQVSQQLDKRSPSCFRFGKSQFRWRIDECGIVLRQITQGNIFRSDKAQLLQIGVSKAPTTPLVFPDAVSKHAREALLGVDLCNTFALGVEHPFLSTLSICRCETKGRLNASTKFVIA